MLRMDRRLGNRAILDDEIASGRAWRGACTALLTDMRERGLHTERAVLAVIDGAKALAKAIRDVYGARALIQRCQAHKARNVTDQFPEGMRSSRRRTRSRT